MKEDMLRLLDWFLPALPQKGLWVLPLSYITSETYHDIVFEAEGRGIMVSRVILLLRQSSVMDGVGQDDHLYAL
jgi:hypothetical protein